MAVAFYTEFAEGSPETATQIGERIMQQVGPQGPAGGIYHAEGPLDGGGWWTFNVWESEGAAMSFFNEILVPTLRDVGGSPDAQPRKLAVHFETNSLLPS